MEVGGRRRAYPAAMNARLAHACVRTASGFGLRVGSAKPHADAATAEDAVPVERAAPTASSLRRLEAETSSVLRDEGRGDAGHAGRRVGGEPGLMPSSAQSESEPSRIGQKKWVRRLFPGCGTEFTGRAF